jgi:hypothetical protein
MFTAVSENRTASISRVGEYDKQATSKLHMENMVLI